MGKERKDLGSEIRKGQLNNKWGVSQIISELCKHFILLFVFVLFDFNCS